MSLKRKAGEWALAPLAGNDRFDALVTDYAMPGLSGADLFSGGRVVQRGLPALTITGFAGINYAEAPPENVLVLHKPFQCPALLDALACIMETTHPSAMPMGIEPVRDPIRMAQWPQSCTYLPSDFITAPLTADLPFGCREQCARDRGGQGSPG